MFELHQILWKRTRLGLGQNQFNPAFLSSAKDIVCYNFDYLPCAKCHCCPLQQLEKPMFLMPLLPPIPDSLRATHLSVNDKAR
jgi:hypothetical protein